MITMMMIERKKQNKITGIQLRKNNAVSRPRKNELNSLLIRGLLQKSTTSLKVIVTRGTTHIKYTPKV